MDIPEEEPRNCPPIPTSLAQIDAEIERVTAEIVKLQEKEMVTQTKPPTTPPPPPRKLIFHDLPDIQNIEIPSGYQRAPITVNFDPAKAEKLCQSENRLRNLLEDERDRDVKELVRTIHSHQAANPFVGIKPVKPPRKHPVPNEDKLLAYLLPEYVLIRKSS